MKSFSRNAIIACHRISCRSLCVSDGVRMSVMVASMTGNAKCVVKSARKKGRKVNSELPSCPLF